MEKKKYEKPFTQGIALGSESPLADESLPFVVDENGNLIVDDPDDAYAKLHTISVWD